MKTITFTCETITPMFLSGADGQTPELRPPSIKGALRFWWRTMNGHLKLEDLKEQEAKIFGSSDEKLGGKSKIIIRYKTINLDTVNTELLPHKKGIMKRNGLMDTFEVTLGLISEVKLSDDYTFNLDKLKVLFEITCLLGGFGKRVRRGMGSVNIRNYKIKDESAENYNLHSLESILGLLNTILPNKFVKKNDSIIATFKQNKPYPYIKQIDLGRANHNILQKIGNTTHDFKQKNVLKYEANFGYATRGRFASPIYISIIKGSKGLQPIITELNTVNERPNHLLDKNLQQDFKNAIL